jgi:hypothetical protein
MAETNEEIRESLYLTRSMIFDKLKSSKFAVKVINKWGGEEKGWITYASKPFIISAL